MAHDRPYIGRDGNQYWDGGKSHTMMDSTDHNGNPIENPSAPMLAPTTDMAEARRRFEAAKAARSGALRTRAGLVKEKDGVMAGIAKKEHYASELENGADYESKRGRYGQKIIQAMRDQAKGLRNEAAGERNAFDERWRTSRRDLARTQREMPRSGVSSTGVGYTTQKVNGVSTLVSDDNKAFIQARRATPDEIAAGRERDSARAASVVGTGGAVAGFDTGMAVGSQAAADHGARLAAHRRSDSGGAAARLRGFYARQQQMANDFRGTAYWRQREQLDAPRRRDFLEAMRINDARATADADRAENSRQFDERIRQYGMDRDANAAQQKALMDFQKGKTMWDRQKLEEDREKGFDPQGYRLPPTFEDKTQAEKEAAEDAFNHSKGLMDHQDMLAEKASVREVETFKRQLPNIFARYGKDKPLTPDEFLKATGGRQDLMRYWPAVNRMWLAYLNGDVEAKNEALDSIS